MSEPPPNRRRRRSFGFRAVVLLLIGGVSYPFSIAPAIWMQREGWLSTRFIDVAYRPWRFVYEMSPPPIDHLFERYAFWWIDDFPARSAPPVNHPAP